MNAKFLEFGKADNVVSRNYKSFRERNNYRKSTDANVRCKKCECLVPNYYHAKNYYKCALQGTSSSAASDVRLSYVCNKFNSARPTMFKEV